MKSKLWQGGQCEQWRHAWTNTLADMLRQPLATLLTVMVIATSLALPSVCYLVWKNANTAAGKWYPVSYLTVYFDKALDDDATENVAKILKSEAGVDKVKYLSREEAMGEFLNWSGFNSAVGMLEQNPLPAVAIITPKMNSQDSATLSALRDRMTSARGVNEVQMDDSWFGRLAALTGLVGQIAAIVGVLMLLAVFLVIGNSVRLSVFSRRCTINVMKLIGATDGFILRPFLNGGAMLGFIGALLSIVLSEMVLLRLQGAVARVTQTFDTTFDPCGLNWDESLLLLIVSATIGWVAAWLTTFRRLRRSLH